MGWSAWKRQGHGFFTRESGKYPSIDGKIEYRFDTGIVKAGGKYLTPRERALDWRRGFSGKVYELHDGYVSKARVSAVKKRGKNSYSFVVTAKISKPRRRRKK